jgi:hypothetical protein
MTSMVLRYSTLMSLTPSMNAPKNVEVDENLI